MAGAWCAENLRDCQGWREANLPMNTGCNEAARLFDAILRQYVSWIDCQSLGGIDNCCQQLLASDPHFVMGRVLILGLEAIGTGKSIRLDEKFATDINVLCTDSAKQDITLRERRHVSAVKLFAEGYMSQAVEIWEDILKEHPTDLLALKFAHDAYFYLGEKECIRDSVGRVLDKWNKSIPLYSYLKGMWAFGLEECGEYETAERQADEALEMHEQDAWATHAKAHVLEMNGRYEQGLLFMNSTLQHWTPCAMLASHNYWHCALYNIEKQDYAAAMDIFDKQIGTRCSSGVPLDLVDACSLLYRFQLEGVEVSERWDSVYEYCRPHFDEHILSFNDIHYCMAILGKGDSDGLQKYRHSLLDYAKAAVGDNKRVMADCGWPICQALIAFGDGRYDAVVDLLYPIRDRIFRIGGSHAQRDVFEQLLIQACLKSPNIEQQKRAMELILRRNQYKKDSPLADRLVSRFKLLHFD